MSVTEIKNYDEFIEKVMKSSQPVLVDFYASWCNPCKILAPTIAKIAEEAVTFSVCKVNVDEVSHAAADFGVESIPTLVVISDGKEINRHIGLADAKTIKAMLE